MTVIELMELLKTQPADAEVRIGDQIEGGPYSNAPVGGVWTSPPDRNGSIERVILCANDDTRWLDECDDPYAHVTGGADAGGNIVNVWKPEP
jgi:hypothetical protein